MSDVLERFGSNTQDLQRDLEELETIICPYCEEMASDVQTEKAGLETRYGKLARDMDKQGEILHRKVTVLISQSKADIAEMKAKHMAALNKNIDEITHSFT
jgi:hypothetical protein